MDAQTFARCRASELVERALGILGSPVETENVIELILGIQDHCAKVGISFEQVQTLAYMRFTTPQPAVDFGVDGDAAEWTPSPFVDEPVSSPDGTRDSFCDPGLDLAPPTLPCQIPSESDEEETQIFDPDLAVIPPPPPIGLRRLESRGIRVARPAKSPGVTEVVQELMGRYGHELSLMDPELADRLRFALYQAEIGQGK